MKILIISPHVPAPVTSQAGERLVFELIKTLASKHELHLVVRVPLGEESTVDAVRAFCRTVHPVAYLRPVRRTIFTIARVIWSYYKICKRAEEIAGKEQFDAIHVEWTETGFFLAKSKTRMAIEAHDVLSKPAERRFKAARGLRRPFQFVLWSLTKAFERHVYRKFDRVFVLSEYDRKYLLSIAPSLDVSVLRYPQSMNLSDRQIIREEKTLLFLAALDRGPNVEAVLYFWNDILPLVRKEVPDVKFYVVGSRPLPEVRALAEKDKQTIVTGFVEDIEPYYKTATIFVAPLLKGGGIIVKILDAFAAGTPVVTTSIGNEGIGAMPGEQLLIGDTSTDFAEHVVNLLRDKPMRERIGRTGREFIKVHYGKDALRKTLNECYPSGDGS